MDIAPLNEKTGYVRWMKSQGLPIHVGHGMADLRTLELAPYSRTGGKAAFIQLHGMQGITGGYFCAADEYIAPISERLPGAGAISRRYQCAVGL